MQRPAAADRRRRRGTPRLLIALAIATCVALGVCSASASAGDAGGGGGGGWSDAFRGDAARDAAGLQHRPASVFYKNKHDAAAATAAAAAAAGGGGGRPEEQPIVADALVAGGNGIAAQFSAFKAAFKKVYTDAPDEQRRLRNFAANLRRMAARQAANPLASFGITKFFDLSEEEFKRMYTGGARHFEAAAEETRRRLVESDKKMKKKNKDKKKNLWLRKTTEDDLDDDEVAAAAKWVHVTRGSPAGLAATTAAPPALDWREGGGVVTPVKDQGTCGSCWAFSAVGNVEAMWALAGNKLVALSEEHLVSCDDVDNACNGGLMHWAYDWLLENANGQLYTEASYPYVSGSGHTPACRSNGAASGELKVGAMIESYAFVEANEELIAAYLATHGPLAIALDANAFMTYTDGIITDCGGHQMNHAVLLVGYDDSAEVPHWIIKNSWGEDWGEEGYVRIRKGTNECLMADYVISAIVSNEPITTEPPRPPGARTVTRVACASDNCRDCSQVYQAETNRCVSHPTVKKASLMVQCDGEGHVIERTYRDSKNCGASASPSVYVAPVDTCMVEWDGSSTVSCV